MDHGSNRRGTDRSIWLNPAIVSCKTYVMVDEPRAHRKSSEMMSFSYSIPLTNIVCAKKKKKKGKKGDVRGGGWLGLKGLQRAGAAIMCLLIAYTRPHDLSFYLLTCIQLIGSQSCGLHSHCAGSFSQWTADTWRNQIPSPWDHNPFQLCRGRAPNEKPAMLWLRDGGPQT